MRLRAKVLAFVNGNRVRVGQEVDVPDSFQPNPNVFERIETAVAEVKARRGRPPKAEQDGEKEDLA